MRVSKTSAALATSGVVTVTDVVPSGLTLVSMEGTGWSCVTNTCNRSDPLQAGSSYPAITVKVNVDADASPPLVNSVNVAGVAAAGGTAIDSTLTTQSTPITPQGSPLGQVSRISPAASNRGCREPVRLVFDRCVVTRR